MRVAQLLSWYDEGPDFLTRSIESSARAGCSALAAIDGRFEQYNSGSPHLSPGGQWRLIERTCARLGLALSLYLPDRPWQHEPEKRTAMFRLADTLDADWYFINDADCEVTKGNLRRLLADVREDAAEVFALTPSAPGVPRLPLGPQEKIRLRCLFRATPGIRAVTNHYTFVTPAGTPLWARYNGKNPIPAADLSDDVEIVHRTYFRPKARQEHQYDYYRQRDKSGVEVGMCTRCGKAKATVLVRGGLRLLADDSIEGDWTGACDACRDDLIRLAKAQVARFGGFPAEVEQWAIPIPKNV